MILRSDLLLWSVAAVLALATGIWYIWAARQAPVQAPVQAVAGPAWLPILGTGLALVALAAGLAWRLWPGQIWPGADGAEGLALMAGGALLCALWQALRDLRRPPAGRGLYRGLGRGAAATWIQGLALLAVAGVIGAAILSGGNLGGAIPALQADGWLLGLRNLSAGLGLGGWLFLAAGALYAGGRYVWRLRPRQAPSPGPPVEAAEELAEPAAALGPARVAEPAVELAPAAAPLSAPLPAPAPLVDVLDPDRAPGPAPRPAVAAGHADHAARFSYPWLTVALLLGGLWSVSAYATPWRGQPAEIWLAITWLLGAAYLHAVAGWQAPELPRAWAHCLAVAGVLAALLAAWSMPALAL